MSTNGQARTGGELLEEEKYSITFSNEFTNAMKRLKDNSITELDLFV